MMFPNLDTIPENADKFAAQEFSPSLSNSMAFSIQAKTSLMADTASPQYTVMGSNLSVNVADMVPVTDETGRSGPFAITQPFVKAFFPYKFIGIQYSANGDVGAGTVSLNMEQRPAKVTL